jgi:hypothetical protein
MSNEKTALKVVYDPTANRHAAKHPVKPIANANAHASKTDAPRTETPKTETPPKKATSDIDAEIYVAMKTLTKNGIKEFSSTVLRDKLNVGKDEGFMNRGRVRKAMKRLEAQGKVVVVEKVAGEGKRYVYTLKG